MACVLVAGITFYVHATDFRSSLQEVKAVSYDSRYAVWVAHYGVGKTTYRGQFGIWQRSSTGAVAGISGYVDINECYIDYPALIKNAGLNGYAAGNRVQHTEYTVKTGDSLWAIAAKFLGSGARYKEIMELNSMTSDVIYSGQVLKIPNT